MTFMAPEKEQSQRALHERQKKILDQLSLIYYTWQRLNVKLPIGMSREDALQCGCIGLIEAIDSFQEGKGKFSTFAFLRIRGAILDGIMDYCWINRSQLRDIQKWQMVWEQLEIQKGETVEQEEVSMFLRLKPGTRERWQRLANMSIVYSDGLEEPENYVFQEDVTPREDWMEETEDKECLENALRRLNGIERKVIEEYYYHQKPLKVVAEENQKSRNWVCAVHRRALKKLRFWMKV